MEPEILKKLEEIEDRIGRVEALSVATSQKVVEMKATQAAQPTIQSVASIPQNTQENLKVQPLINKPEGGYESYFGRWILGVVGLLAVLVGTSLFLQYIFDQNLIPPAGRVLIGLGLGAAFVALGEYVRKSQARQLPTSGEGGLEKYAQLLTAGGLGLLYLSIYSAYGYYNLVSAGNSFILMMLVTILGVILSLRANSQVLASLAATAGFLVPSLFGFSITSDFGYFIYILALNIGMLTISFFRKWRQLAGIGFVGTVLNYSAWYAYYYTPDKLAITIYALVVFFLTYLIANLAHNFIADEKSSQDDLVILTLNPIWFFFELYYLLTAGNSVALSFIAVGLSALYIVLAGLFKLYRNDDPMFALFLGAISAFFLTIAIPLRFEQNAVTIAWAVEAVLMAMLGALTGNDGMKRATLAIFTLALCRFFFFDNFGLIQDLRTWIPFFNKQFFTYLIMIFSGTIIAYLFGHLMGEEYRSDKRVIASLWIVVNLLILGSVTSEITKYFAQAQISSGYSLANQSNAAVSIFWMVYAVSVITLGMVLQNSFLRKISLVLFSVTIFKVFIFDLSGLDTPYRIMSFMVLGVILLAVSYLYFKHQKNVESVPTNLPM